MNRTDGIAMAASTTTRYPETPYTRAFFEHHRESALLSARVVAPIVMQLIHPQSVVDVGCGIGLWLDAFCHAGVERILGMDGSYIDRRQLVIDPACFVEADLERPSIISSKFDLAMSTEVAEHLSPSAGDALVAMLTSAAPVVLFSAAVPGQGGDDHINEQWPSYWIERFAAHGYSLVDAIRPQIREDARVVWYYRQNLMMFASAQAFDAYPALNEWRSDCPKEGLEWVHINAVRYHLSDLAALKRAPGAMRRKLVRVARRMLRGDFRISRGMNEPH